MFRVKEPRLALDQAYNPVVILFNEEETWYLPIWIGPNEATAIAMELQGIKPPRPLTHDLMRNIIEAVHYNVDRVVITEVKDNTYFAQIHLYTGPRREQVPADDMIRVDSRPSDAIAFAVRTRAPIFVAETLLTATLSLQLQPGEKPKKMSEQDWEEMLRRIREAKSPKDLLGGSDAH